MIRQSEEKNGINVITIGPLTNVAIALLTRQSLKINKLVVMGGTSYASGNVRPSAEFNVHTDPEAAHIVFERVPFLTLVPWETCFKNKFEHQWIIDWIQGDSDIKRLL
mmetsp:Transcript_29811/g.5381  ORF Transcript_29811/g.5381 Transcript_29811/m.5381 type:complete len:108 (+) Transcript_29811:355-678(+)